MLTSTDEAAEVPHVLDAVTVTFPLVELAVAEILFVVDVPIQPTGIVHVYDVAPATAVTLYVLVVPEHIAAVPEIAPGVVGDVFTVIACDDAELVPQAFVAATVTLPLVAFAVAEIELVVDVPVQPTGIVHV